MKRLKPRRQEIAALVVSLGLATLAILIIISEPGDHARAEATFCTPQGEAAGQCDSPQGVAADFDTGNAYVADQKNNRISVFDSTGAFQFAFGWGVDTGASALEKCTTASGCQKGSAGAGAGQLSDPSRIAIDNTADLLFVVGANNARVQKFNLDGTLAAAPNSFTTTGACTIDTNDPLAVGPTGFFYVADADAGEVSKLNATTGACEGKVALTALGIGDLVVDPGGNLWATMFFGGLVLRKYSPTGTELCSPAVGSPEPNRETTAIGVDAAGNVYATQREEGANRVITLRTVTEYSPSCAAQQRWAYEEIAENPSGIAPYASAGGDAFVVEDPFQPQDPGTVFYLAAPAPGPIALPGGVEVAGSPSNTKATLRAEVNPEGKATTYRFEYLTQADYEAQGNSFTGLATKSTAPQVLSATDFVLHSVQALVGCPDPVTESGGGTCLTPETEYRFRVVATNSDGAGEGTADGGTFTTGPAVDVIEVFATEVGLEAARLNGVVNPLGIPATAYFEYVEDATYQADKGSGDGFQNATKVPSGSEIDFGAEEAETLKSAPISGLDAGTTYHYRLSVTNPLVAPDRFLSEERTLRTFATPVGETCAANEAFRTGASSTLVDCRAYELVSPLDKEGGDVIPLGEATTEVPGMLTQSSLSGSKLAYGSYRAFGDAASSPFTSQYVAERGATEWTTHTITGPRRHLNSLPLSTLDTELKALSPDLCEAWLQTVAEPPLAPGAVTGYRNLYRRSDGGDCGTQSWEALTTEAPAHQPPVFEYELELQGLSADGETSIFTANDNLPGTSAPDNATKKRQLYRRTASGTEFLCILPGEVASGNACSAGTLPSSILASGQNRGASIDNAISADGQRIFWTNSGGPGKIYLRLVAASETIPVSAAGETASSTTSSIFLKGSGDGSKALYLTGSDLYLFTVAGTLTTPIAGEVAGILGASEDLSRIYLLSEEDLSGPNGEGKEPEAGKSNLYLYEAGSFTFVATLADADTNPEPAKGFMSPISLTPFKRGSRITPDASHAIFMSFASPTGYDNKDAADRDIVDTELFRYDATSEELLCVSCNPTSARPEGSRDFPRGEGRFWGAGVIGGWENIFYAPRNLSADGDRVYFESPDVLSPRDTNGLADVYQWQAPGSGSCTAARFSYSEANGGCIDLVSSGQSDRVSEFNDASPSGSDVFFTTLQSLVPQDYGLVDVYDARAGGGLSGPPPLASECEGEGCQVPAPAPARQTPSSLGDEGPGNVVEPQAKPKKCPKGKVKKNGRCVKKHKAKGGKKNKGKANKNGRAGR